MGESRPYDKPESLYCAQCQTSLSHVDHFCPNCGTARPIFANPLGPKDLKGLFTGIFQIYRASFLAIIIVVSIIEVPLSLMGFWFTSIVGDTVLEAFGPLFDSTADHGTNSSVIDTSRIFDVLLSVSYAVIVMAIATLLASVIKTGALTYGTSVQIIGRPIDVAAAYSFAVGRFSTMVGAAALSYLIVILLSITIIGIPVAILFSVRWFFIMQTASLERCGPTGALARSSDLVRGNWWRVFGIMSLILITFGIANGIVGSVLGLIPYVGPVVTAILFAPVLIIFQTLLYHDLRLRHDGSELYTSAVLDRELKPDGTI